MDKEYSSTYKSYIQFLNNFSISFLCRRFRIALLFYMKKDLIKGGKETNILKYIILTSHVINKF